MKIFGMTFGKKQAPTPDNYYIGGSYAPDYEKFLSEAYDNPMFSPCFKEIISNFNNIKIYVATEDDKGNLVKSNSIINETLKNPNSELTQSKWNNYYLTWLFLGGAVCLWKSPGVVRKEMRIYSPSGFEANTKKNTVRIGTSIYHEGGGINDISQVKVIKTVNPNDSMAGFEDNYRGLLRSSAIPGDISNFGLRHQSSKLKSAGRKSGILTYKTQLNEAKREELEEKISGQMKQDGIIAIKGNEYDLIDLGTNNKELDWLESMKYVQKLIAINFNIPAPLITFEDMTYANLEGYKKKVYHDTVIPLAKEYVEELNKFFEADLRDGEKIIYDISDIKILQIDTADEVSKLAKAFEGHITENEFRTLLNDKVKMNLAPLPKELGDKILVNAGKIWLNDIGYEDTGGDE